jgi:hypothetical protein
MRRIDQLNWKTKNLISRKKKYRTFFSSSHGTRERFKNLFIFFGLVMRQSETETKKKKLSWISAVMVGYNHPLQMYHSLFFCQIKFIGPSHP